jgi:colanic acid/amylovoran biosynthesis protein
LEDDLSPQVLKAVYAELEIMIGTRAHSNVIAMASGTPVVAIAYEHKIAGMMEMLGLDDFSLPIDRTHERLLDAVQRLWDERTAVRALLGGRIEQMQNESQQSARYVRMAPDFRGV